LPADISLMNAFSCVSDYLKESSGVFRIAVPPGRYTLQFEPIRNGFNAGSSVGPWAETNTSPSFKNAIHAFDRTSPITVDAGHVVDVGQIVAQ